MSSSQESQSPKLTRRDALKALAAATGAVVLSNLPQEWKTPIVEVGVMPAHAQGASGPAPQISNLWSAWTSGGNSSCTVYGQFNYFDSLGQVTNGSTVNGSFNGNQPFSSVFPTSLWFCGTSSGSNGALVFWLNSTICPTNGTNSTIRVQLLVNGRYSNVLNGTVVVS
jgi:hypothetical protein